MQITWFSLTLTPTEAFFNATDEYFDYDFESMADNFINTYEMYCAGNPRWLMENQKPVQAHLSENEHGEIVYRNKERTRRLLTAAINRLEAKYGLKECEKFLNYLFLYPETILGALDCSEEIQTMFVEKKLNAKF